MWVFVKNGFFSAVDHRGDKRLVMVRARFAGDLERLFEAHGVDAAVVETPAADYRYRANIPKNEWARIMLDEALAIDYHNFKAAAHDGTARDEAYMDCWCAMRHAQEGNR